MAATGQGGRCFCGHCVTTVSGFILNDILPASQKQALFQIIRKASSDGGSADIKNLPEGKMWKPGATPLKNDTNRMISPERAK
jgi:hypothetical protein